VGVSFTAAVSGCLTNPWGPNSEGENEDGGVTGGTSPDGDGSDAAATDDGQDDADARDTDGENTDTGSSGEETTAEPTQTTVPPEDREPDQVVEVAADGYQFTPESFEVASGDTVHWVWRDGGHNVRVRSKPGGSDWEGTPGGATDTYSEGYVHAFTFETSGEYEYYCAPHQSLGLEGSFTVR
jgi:plastocyanin